ncbi:MAG: DUF3426 domain-containing protein [Alphaproteobacteria bacterium]|nr:DUF3426 domain-containing protein [Alphaproteobacteria bacterium]
MPPADAPRPLEIAALRDEEPRGVGDRPQLPALPPRRRGKSGLVWLAVAAFLVLGAVAVAVLLRDQVVALWPPAADLFAEAGLRTTPPGPIFEIRKTTPSLDKENGVPVVIVEGEIANVSNAARDVPKLRVILKDKDGKEIEQSTVAVPGPRLLPGASVPFRTSLPQPSTAATSVVVMISDDG